MWQQSREELFVYEFYDISEYDRSDATYCTHQYCQKVYVGPPVIFQNFDGSRL